MKRVKGLVICVILLSITIVLHGEDTSGIDVDYYGDRIFSLIGNFSRIIENNRANMLVYDTFVVSNSAVRGNTVQLSIDPSLNTVLSGMQLRIHPTGQVSLVFGPRFLDTYTPGSSIHYAILMHEYRHLHDYIRNGDHYRDARNFIFGAYRYELDAYRIQAEFIKHYLSGEQYTLSRFEQFLLASLEGDNLNSASVFLLREGMNVYFGLNRIEIGLLENTISSENALGELLHRGNYLLNSYHEAEGSFDRFFNYIELLTFNKYMIALIPGIVNNPTMTWGEVFSLYPEIERIYEAIAVIRDSDNSMHNDYLLSIIDLWENDIVRLF